MVDRRRRFAPESSLRATGGAGLRFMSSAPHISSSYSTASLVGTITHANRIEGPRRQTEKALRAVTFMGRDRDPSMFCTGYTGPAISNQTCAGRPIPRGFNKDFRDYKKQWQTSKNMVSFHDGVH
jgi:hypothetical protein